MDNQVNHSDLIMKILDYIVKENMSVMDEVKHLQKLQDLGLPQPDDIQIRMASMQAKMEFCVSVMNLLSPAIGGIQIVLPTNLLNSQNPTDEQ